MRLKANDFGDSLTTKAGVGWCRTLPETTTHFLLVQIALKKTA